MASSAGNTLIFQTVANGNDWDGAANNGQLRADAAGTLELHDNSTFVFTGTVTAAALSTVSTNGFGLDFNPGSALTLTGGTYKSTHSTNLGGTVIATNVGGSTIEVENNVFLIFESTSSTTLSGDLTLKNNNINIDAGATFSGAGALIIDELSHFVVDDGATVNALLVNEGSFRPNGIVGVGTATVKDYTQTSTGKLIMELNGILPNQFDRLQATGIAQIDGMLTVDLNLGFNPALGTTFDIVSTAFGVSGTFDLIDYQNLPADKTLYVSYPGNIVRLTVVNKPSYAADFDDDGDVDITDYGIWRHNFQLNQLGDATGDNISNAADYVIWRKQLGLGPLPPGSGAALPNQAGVPEPATSTMALGLVILLYGIDRRRQIT